MEEKPENQQLIETKENHKKKIKEILPNIGIKTVVVIVGIILFVLAINAIIKTATFTNSYNVYNENIIYEEDNIFQNIGLLILAILLLYGISKLLQNVKKTYLLVGVLITYVILSILWILFSKTPLRADQKVVEEIAKQFMNGNYGTLEIGQYMYNHPLQISIVFFIEIIYRITGITDPIIFKFCNVIFSTISILYLYKITGKLFKKDMIQKIFLILIFGCFILELFNVYVYGNIVGLMFGVIAIYYTMCFLENRKIHNLVILTISILCSVILKSNYQVYLIGIIITLMLDLFKKIDIKIIASVAIIILLYIGISKGLIKIMELRSNKEVSDGIPMISYIYMGIAPKVDRASGWYNAIYDVEKMYRDNNYDTNQTKEYSINGIKDRIKEMSNDIPYTIEFFKDKMLSTWIEPSFQTIWTNKPAEEYEKVKDEISDNKILISIYDGKINGVLTKYFDIYDIIIYVFALIYIVLSFKNLNVNQFIMLLIFFGGFLFHMIWETKSIYAIPFFLLLIPYSAAGFYKGINKILNQIIEGVKKHGKNISNRFLL